ncbi:MAG TPA: hypothetical protein VLZ83_07745 [Edaphocola sp.]|nr:hypothetical protein [Edaphocola sp.]
MNKHLLFTALSILTFSYGYAQVEDVSIIVTPTMSYNWFDGKSTIEKGPMWGVQAGFGFGKYIELHGIYEQSFNMKQNFGSYESDIRELFPNFNFTDRKINVNRIGGEFKANIPGKHFAPYIILGTGVQTFERDNDTLNLFKNQNLYGTGGLGFKINLTDRVTINLEGRGLVYNMNPGSLLYDPNGSDDFNDWINTQDRTVMYNWNVAAGLQFYLGGRGENEYSDMDQAYLNRFSSGFSGMKLTLAPAGAYVAFNQKSAYRSTYMLGGVLGMDITDFVGIRGYYYQSTEGKDPSFDFDELSMFGVDFLGQLNVPRGIVPYITVGAGYINVNDAYKGKQLSVLPIAYQKAASGYYAKGGAGLSVPLGKYVDVFGAANLMYTVEDKNMKIIDISNTDQLRQHTMYNVGVKLKLGKSANTDKQTDKAFDNRFSSERNAYNEQINSLEKELKTAYDNNDVEKVTEIMAEKKSLEIKSTKTKDDLIRLTPAELESLIDKVIDGVENEQTPILENKLDRLEHLLLDMKKQGTSSNINNTQPETVNQMNDDANYSTVNDRLIAEINKLNQKIDMQQQSINMLQNQNQNVVTTPSVITVVPNTSGNAQVVGAVLNRGMGMYIGGSFGDAATTNVGIRGFYGFTNSEIMFMPEAYVALGSINGFGVSANGIYPIDIANSRFQPYVGLGLGLHYLGEELSFNTNVIAGTGFKIGRGSLFADYSIRGLFRNNQIAAGYRFKF